MKVVATVQQVTCIYFVCVRSMRFCVEICCLVYLLSMDNHCCLTGGMVNITKKSLRLTMIDSVESGTFLECISIWIVWSCHFDKVRIYYIEVIILKLLSKYFICFKIEL